LRFSAETDKEALSMAHDTIDGASAVARFDLWQDERHIEGAAPTMKESPAGEGRGQVDTRRLA
jgi:hypothetical protein